jgi:hypothetical protein
VSISGISERKSSVFVNASDEVTEHTFSTWTHRSATLRIPLAHMLVFSVFMKGKIKNDDTPVMNQKLSTNTSFFKRAHLAKFPVFLRGE